MHTRQKSTFWKSAINVIDVVLVSLLPISNIFYSFFSINIFDLDQINVLLHISYLQLGVTKTFQYLSHISTKESHTFTCIFCLIIWIKEFWKNFVSLANPVVVRVSFSILTTVFLYFKISFKYWWQRHWLADIRRKLNKGNILLLHNSCIKVLKVITVWKHYKLCRSSIF